MLFAVIYYGAWFPALVVYSKITFAGTATYIESYSILLFSILPPLLLGKVTAITLNSWGPYKTALLGISIDFAATVGLLVESQTAWILFYVALSSFGVTLVYPLRPIFIRGAFEIDRRELLTSRLTRMRSSGTLFAPPLAGVAVVSFGPSPVLIGYLISCVVAAALVWSMSVVEVSRTVIRPNETKPTIFSEIIIHPWQFMTLCSLMYIIIMFDLLYPILLRDKGLGELRTFSLLLMAFAAGSICATFFKFKRETYICSLTIGLMPLGLLVSSGQSYITVMFLIVIAFLIGFSHTRISIRTNIDLQNSPSFTVNTAVVMGMASSSGQLFAIILCMLLSVTKISFELASVAGLAGVALLLLSATRDANISTRPLSQ